MAFLDVKYSTDRHTRGDNVQHTLADLYTYPHRYIHPYTDSNPYNDAHIYTHAHLHTNGYPNQYPLTAATWTYNIVGTLYEQWRF